MRILKSRKAPYKNVIDELKPTITFEKILLLAVDEQRKLYRGKVERIRQGVDLHDYPTGSLAGTKVRNLTRYFLRLFHMTALNAVIAVFRGRLLERDKIINKNE